MALHRDGDVLAAGGFRRDIRWAGGAAGCRCGRVDQGLLGLHGAGASYPGVGVGVRLDVGATWWCVAVVLRSCAARLLAAICARDPTMLRRWIVIVR